MANIWLTSDTHFGHANVIKYCNRPFASLEEMDETLISNWNARVKPGDTVYHLGDFHLGKSQDLAGYRARLNGRIVLVLGNHDRTVTAMRRAGFDDVAKHIRLATAQGMFLLAHKPIAEWDFPDDTDAQLCGHVHGEWKHDGHRINVGVDVRGFAPASLAELLEDAS